MRLSFGSPSIHSKTGEIGARAQLSFIEHGWAGQYEFDTHGMAPADVAVKVQELRAHPAKKCKRLDGFAGVRFVEFTVATRVFRVVDCTVWERAGEVELYLDMREVVGSNLLAVPGFPRHQRFATIEDVVDNGTIITKINSVLQQRVAAEAAHANFLNQATALIAAQVQAP